MFLFLNPAHHQFFTLALIDKKGEILIYKKINAQYQQSEKLLTNINTFMSSRRKSGYRKEINQKFCFLDSSFRWNDKKGLNFLQGIIVVSGPGGFTSLRIGLATANALAWSLQIPIVGLESKCKVLDNQEISAQIFKENDEKMIKIGFNKLKKVKKFKQVLPKYGSEPHINIKNS